MGDESCRSEYVDHLSSCFMHFHSARDLSQLPRDQPIVYWINDPRSIRGYAKANGYYSISDYPPRSIPTPRVEDLVTGDIDSNLICCVCQNFLKDAIVLSPCAHVIGLPCFRWLRHPKCPKCGEQISLTSTLIPARYPRDTIPTIELHCPFGMSYDLDSRKYVPIQRVLETIRASASGEGGMQEHQLFCSNTIQLQDLAIHILDCPFRPQRCSEGHHGCTAITPQEGLIKALHDRSICPGRRVQSCSQCGTSLHFTELEAHKNECLGGMVNCKNAVIGCPEMVSRGDLPAHMEHCPYSSELVRRDLTNCYKRIDELERENQLLKDTVTALRMQLGEEFAVSLGS